MTQNWRSCYPLISLVNLMITVPLIVGIIGTTIYTYEQDILWNSEIRNGKLNIKTAFNLSDDIHFHFRKNKPYPTYYDNYVLIAKHSKDADFLVRDQINVRLDLSLREIWKQTIHLLILIISGVTIIINFILSHCYFKDPNGPKYNLLYFTILSIATTMGLFFNVFSIRDIDHGYQEIKLISRKVLVYVAKVKDSEVSDLVHVCEIKAYLAPWYNHADRKDLADRIKQRKVCHNVRIKLITGEIQVGLLAIVLTYTTYCLIFVKWCFNTNQVAPESDPLYELHRRDEKELRKLSNVSAVSSTGSSPPTSKRNSSGLGSGQTILKPSSLNKSKLRRQESPTKQNPKVRLITSGPLSVSSGSEPKEMELSSISLPIIVNQ